MWQKKGTVRARGQIPVVRLQVHASALQRTNDTSTTTTYGVENPTGYPVPKAVPQSIRGLSTAAPGEEEENARKRKSANPQVCDECDMWLSRPSGMPCHKADRSQGKPAKFKCDECGASLLRLDTIRRRKQEHCKYRHRRNGGGGSLQSPSREGPEGGEGGMESMGGCILSWQS